MRLGYSESAGQYFDLDTGEPVNSAAAEASPVDAFLINAGEKFHNLGQRIGLLDPVDVPEGAMEQLRDVNPISSTAGSMAPYLATAPLPGGIVAQAGYGGLTGAGFANEGEATNEGLYGAAGGVLGDIAGRVIGRVMGMRPKPAPKTPMAQQYADTGGTLTPGMAWDFQPLKDFENWLQAKPGGSMAYSGVGKANTGNTNQLALDALGIGDQGFKTLGDDAINAAYDTIGSKFDEIGDALPDVNVPADLADDLRTYLGKSGKLSRTMERIGIEGYGEAGEDMVLNGRGLMSVRSRLLKQAKGASGEDAVAYGDLIDDIDDLMQANSPQGLADLYGEARGQYRMLKAVEKNLSPEGNVYPGRLSRTLRDWRTSEGPAGALRQNVQAGSSQALGSPYGNSGTAQRSIPWGEYPLAPVWGGLGYAERGLLQPFSPASRYGGALGAGGLLEYQDQ